MVKKSYQLWLASLILSALVGISNIYSMDKVDEILNKTQDELDKIITIEPWRVLGLTEDNIAGAKKNYYMLSKKHHPDRGGTEKKCKAINVAYENILKDQENAIPGLNSALARRLYSLVISGINFIAIQEEALERLGIKDTMKLILKQVKKLKDSGYKVYLNAYDFNLLANICRHNLKKIEYWTYIPRNFGHDPTAGHSCRDNVRKAEEAAIELKEKYLYDTPRQLAGLDILNFINESYRISTLGSSDKSKIDIAASLGNILNIISIVNGGFFSLNLLGNSFENIDNLLKRDFIDKLGRFAKLLPAAFAFKFIAHDSEVVRNASKIAKYNRETNRNISRSKIKQFAWLTANKILPYVAFGLSRKIRDEASISEIFGESLKESDGKSVRLLEFLKSTADVSEIARKHFRNKVEIGNYKAYIAR